MNRFGNCDKAIATARNILYETPDFHSNWVQLISTIFTNSGWQHRGNSVPTNRKTLLYQTSYPPFFESWTTQCNGVRFAPGLGALLTQALRDKLNLLGQELNAVLAAWIDQQNYIRSSYIIGAIPPANTPWFMKFSNQDEFYNNHRFCRQDVTEPDRNNPQTWFFNLFSNSDGVTANNETTVTSANFDATWHINSRTCNSTADQGEFADTLPCLISQAIANGTTDNNTVWPATPEAIQKTFHPRTQGFLSTAQNIQKDLLYEPVGQFGSVLNNKHLRIMGIGDSLAFGISDISYVAGYRETLYELLTSERTNRVEFVGTQHQGPEPYNSMEGYLTDGVTGVLDKLQKNKAIQNLQPNIIILTAGFLDIKNIDTNDYNSLQQLRTDLTSLVNYVFTACSSCTVLVGDIPPPPQPFQWPAAADRKQRFQFNAMISEIVNQQATQNNRHITKLHFSVPSGETVQGTGYPTQRGYQYMAYDIVEKFALIDRSGWISPAGVDDNSVTASSTLPPIPLRLSATPGVPTIGASVSSGRSPPPQSSSAAATSTCTGDQIEGSCTQASLPSATPDSGPEAPVCNKVDSSGDFLMFNATQASQGASQYCENLISTKVILSSSNKSPKPGYVANAAEKGGYIALAVTLDVDSCDPGTAASNQQLDFGSWTQDKCYQYMYTTLAEACAKDPTWKDYDPKFTLEGGLYAASCVLWGMQGVPGSPPKDG
ncbi:MAG: hypothetical protein Q9227_005677 [Pyrenula ochraceoflavens]